MEIILLEILNPKMWSHQLRKSFRREKYKVEARKLAENHNIYVKLSKARFEIPHINLHWSRAKQQLL